MLYILAKARIAAAEELEGQLKSFAGFFGSLIAISTIGILYYVEQSGLSAVNGN